ncbi:uncharacterized protein LOC125192149 [Salvia hispanica]|uniref:uncharacterized protein LOC125192149 n=1 Tax=Salvia hispanica TaxID=49212 RepID=UPI0020093837|nr:uncharacterized protein LOC125192149 [Salvia hispanica]
MRNKPFPYYDQLSFVWGKDRAAGPNSEAVPDMVEDIDREQNVNQGNEESGEDGAPSISTTRGEGTSKKHERKRKRSSDGLILSLERMTNVFNEQMEKSNDQMGKIIESFNAGDKEKKDNRHKLNQKLEEIEGLSAYDRQTAAMKLVRDPDLLDYFFTLHDEDAKEIFLKQLLG